MPDCGNVNTFEWPSAQGRTSGSGRVRQNYDQIDASVECTCLLIEPNHHQATLYWARVLRSLPRAWDASFKI